MGQRPVKRQPKNWNPLLSHRIKRKRKKVTRVVMGWRTDRIDPKKIWSMQSTNNEIHSAVFWRTVILVFFVIFELGPRFRILVKHK